MRGGNAEGKTGAWGAEKGSQQPPLEVLAALHAGSTQHESIRVLQRSHGDAMHSFVAIVSRGSALRVLACQAAGSTPPGMSGCWQYREGPVVRCGQQCENNVLLQVGGGSTVHVYVQPDVRPGVAVTVSDHERDGLLGNS